MPPPVAGGGSARHPSSPPAQTPAAAFLRPALRGGHRPGLGRHCFSRLSSRPRPEPLPAAGPRRAALPPLRAGRGFPGATGGTAGRPLRSGARLLAVGLGPEPGGGAALAAAGLGLRGVGPAPPVCPRRLRLWLRPAGRGAQLAAVARPGHGTSPGERCGGCRGEGGPPSPSLGDQGARLHLQPAPRVGPW